MLKICENGEKDIFLFQYIQKSTKEELDKIFEISKLDLYEDLIKKINFILTKD